MNLSKTLLQFFVLFLHSLFIAKFFPSLLFFLFENVYLCVQKRCCSFAECFFSHLSSKVSPICVLIADNIVEVSELPLFMFTDRVVGLQFPYFLVNLRGITDDLYDFFCHSSIKDINLDRTTRTLAAALEVWL